MYRPIHRLFSSAPAENFYTLLHLPQRFTLSTSQLSDNFKQAQRQWHPDKFASASSHQQQQAANMSARLNRAYSALRDPTLRAQHLLELKGANSHDVKLEPSFLAWVMDIREQMVDAVGSHNADDIRKESDMRMEQCIQDLERAFETDQIENAAVETARLRYLGKIQAELDDVLPPS